MADRMMERRYVFLGIPFLKITTNEIDFHGREPITESEMLRNPLRSPPEPEPDWRELAKTMKDGRS